MRDIPHDIAGDHNNGNRQQNAWAESLATERSKVIKNTVKLLEKASEKDLRLFYQLAYLVVRRE